MRYINLFLPTFLLLASCSDVNMEEPEIVGQKTIVASADSYEKTGRTSFEEGNGGEMLGVYWTPGDQIGVFSASGKENSCFGTAIKENAAYAAFTGDLPKTPAYAYYPYAANNGDARAIQGNLPAEQAYNEGKLAYDYKYGVPRDAHASEFTFTHFFPMIRFVVDAKGSKTMIGDKLVSVTLTLPSDTKFHVGDFTADAVNGNVNWTTSAAANELKMIWTDQPVMSADKIVYGYLFMDAVKGLRNKMLQVTLTTNKQTKTFKSPLVIDEFKPNYIYNVPLTLAGWENQFVDPNPGDDGLHFGGGSADGSEILSLKPVFE